MDNDDERDVEIIATDIMEYLQSHPRAGDSAQGVARWWLKPSHDTVPLEQVEDALELLVSRGVLRRLMLANGSVLYSHAPLTPLKD